MGITQPTPHTHIWGCYSIEGDFGEIIRYKPLNQDEIDTIASDPNSIDICEKGEIRCIRCGATHPRNTDSKLPNWDEIQNHLQ